ncbi:hypothetical protein [Cupriavidus necator]|uniref:hypothetical protein n=1 Tax=Cupriavidus necator TaxID=106590 RepID=UPI0011D21AE5|nr:hypothetical protein [Cupriavidus necator]MDX6008769.1 hypothetical protein [Cupriavidus necator]
MAAVFRSKLSTSVASVNPSLDTSVLFDATYVEGTGSPIDEFLMRLVAINQLAPPPAAFNPLQAQLVLLGVIAAVESYLRAILRRLIAMDSICQESVHRRDVSYGAAIHLTKDMLPEAVLEKISFISKGSIVDSIRELAGIKGNLPPDVTASIDDYVKICHLRHCAVHRFGKLGVSNAIALGLEDHKELLEKPLLLDYLSLQNSIVISTGMVKTINNFLFNEIVSRISDSRWTGVYKTDKRLFLTYYKIFADTISTTGFSVGLKDMYILFMSQKAKFSAGLPF